MIIDQSALTGLNAYLIPVENANPNPVDLSGTAHLTGRSPQLGPGDTVEVTGINLLIEAADLDPLFGRQASKLFSVKVNKEMFPLLIEDPYSNRVHNIGGFEDFKRGITERIRVLEVEGIPTLVSVGDGTCTWSSMIYRMPHPVRFSSAAWHLGASRNVPEKAFTYSLDLDLWVPGLDVSQPPSETANLAASRNPTDIRLSAVTQTKAAAAYRIRFEADVRQDSFLRERLSGPNDAESLGRPLLQAVNLLEPVDPLHEFFSLHELLLRCSDHELHWVPGEPLRRVTALLDLRATLTGPDVEGRPGESIELTVHSDAFSYLEARLEANVLVRPPRG